MKKVVDNKNIPSYHRHMTKKTKPLTREEMYKLAQDALSERIDQLINQRESAKRYRENQRKKNVRKK